VTLVWRRRTKFSRSVSRADNRSTSRRRRSLLPFLAIIITVAVFLVSTSETSAQPVGPLMLASPAPQQADRPPVFEVASIKPSLDFHA
jgi:hypothetical protein